MKKRLIIDPLLEYHEIARLNLRELSRFINYVENSGVVEIADESVTGRLNHIVFSGEKKPIAYFGADNQLELVGDYKDLSLRIPHSYIIGLCLSSLDEKQRLLF